VKSTILKITTILWLLSMNSMSFALNANSGQNISLTNDDSPNFNIGIQTGFLDGETLEQVFSSGRKLSELKWDMSNVFYGGAVVSSELSERLYLNFGYWTDLDSNEGELSDSDFISPNPLERTFLSIHDAKLQDLDIMDVNLGVAFLKFNGETVSSASSFGIDSALSFQAILGYRTDDASWVGRDGFLFYPADSLGIPVFGDVIEYERKIHFPYLGLGIDLTVHKKLGVNVYYLRSRWVRAEDNDKHILRDLRFLGSMDNGDFQAIGANLRWEFCKNLSMIASVSKENIDKTKGTTVIRILSTNEVLLGEAGGSAAIENDNVSAALGIAYQFG
jgi:outer membrane protease